MLDIWNGLSEEIVTAESVHKFKGKLDECRYGDSYYEPCSNPVTYNKNWQLFFCLAMLFATLFSDFNKFESLVEASELMAYQFRISTCCIWWLSPVVY
ncbi:hypothetical protein E2C01_025069 [Portunus trituberculatus]|uniref:Uncharacterized protein n=1 Tax=Portunus trituberculatus TaxID=210409 RepID=A0A5B7EFK3_PORTR|nr:hypothetical protein [Portunus trituberculatus]